MVKFINRFVSKEAADILYKIGLPNHNTFGGGYDFFFGNVELLDQKYLKIGTRNTFINEPFGLCIEIETQKIIGRTNYSDGIKTYTINKNLKTNLEYLYIFRRFTNEVRTHKILPKLLIYKTITSQNTLLRRVFSVFLKALSPPNLSF